MSIVITKPDTYGWEAAVRGIRNPLNSWDRSDTEFETHGVRIGPKDMHLMRSLIEGGYDHAKFLRMIGISMDICAPLYWWKEFDTYKIGTVANSCSTMHTIASREFTADDFSCGHLNATTLMPVPGKTSMDILQEVIDALNYWRGLYLETHDKAYWWQLIQLLPSSFNQLRTVTLNYEVARRQYDRRHAHKLDEWHVYCDQLAALPYADELIVN